VGGRAAERTELWRRSAVIVVAALAVKVVAGTTADPDLWGHLRYGQLHLALDRVLRADPFAFVPTREVWINHEWLFEVAIAWLHARGGTAGLVLLKLAILVPVFGLPYRRLRREGLGPVRAATLLVLFFVGVLPWLSALRPQIATYLLFALLLALLPGLGKGRRVALLALLPLFALWGNLHGGVLAGIGVLGLWAAGRLGEDLLGRSRDMRRALRRSLPAAGALLLAGVATLLNPYGIELPAFLLETATGARPEIADWQPLRLQSARGAVYLLQAAVLAYALVHSPRPLDPARLLPLGVVALLPLVAVRHHPLFGIAAPLLAAEHLAVFGRRERAGVGATERGEEPVEGTRSRRWIGPLLGTAALVTAGVILWKTGPSFRCIAVEPRSGLTYPARAVAWLQRSGATGNLATHFNWGQYAIWHLGPEIRVGMDGRRETVYPDSTYGEYFRFVRGAGAWSGHLDRYGADGALLPAGIAADNLLKGRPGWNEVYRDSVAVLYLREGSPLREPLLSTPVPEVPVDGEGLCFPEPGEADPARRVLPGQAESGPGTGLRASPVGR